MFFELKNGEFFRNRGETPRFSNRPPINKPCVQHLRISLFDKGFPFFDQSWTIRGTGIAKLSIKVKNYGRYDTMWLIWQCWKIWSLFRARCVKMIIKEKINGKWFWRSDSFLPDTDEKNQGLDTDCLFPSHDIDHRQS